MIDSYARRIMVTRVVDGDTIVGNVDLGYHTWAFDVTFRVARVDTPELRSGSLKDRQNGLLAKTFTEVWLHEHKDHGLVATSMEADNWRRWLAEIECAQEHNLSDDLLAAGHALLYHRE